jgi:DnaJ family protein A protein 2
MFQHLDGRGIRLISPKGQRVVRHGDELAVACEGMPKRGAAGKGAVNRGDLRVKVGVEMPDPSWAMRQPDVSIVSP